MSSLVFTASRSTYLQRNIAPTNTTTFSISVWYKRSSDDTQFIFLNGPTGYGFEISCQTGGTILVSQNYNASFSLQTTNIIAVSDTWHHILVAIDTKQVNQVNRAHIYLDGSECSYIIPSYPVQFSTLLLSATSVIGSSGGLGLGGGGGGGGGGFLNGKLDEFYYADGYQLVPSDVIVVAAKPGPKIYTGPLGLAGSYLNFDNTVSLASICADRSGNHNDWTPYNFVIGDSSIDSPGTVVTPVDLVVGSPIFGFPVLMAGTVVGLDLVVGSPVLDTPAFRPLGVNKLVALDGDVLSPQLGRPFFVNYLPVSIGAAWSRDPGLVLGAGQIAPIGFGDGIALIDTAVSSHFRIWQPVSKLAIAQTYRLSVDVAPTGSGKNAELRLDDGASAYAYAIFDPVTGECLKRDCTADFRLLAIEADPLRWNFRRLVLMAESNSSTIINGTIAMTSGLNETYTGDGTGSLVVYNPLLLNGFDRRDFRWEIGKPEMRFYWTVHISDVGLRWFRCAQGELGIDHHLEFQAPMDLDCVLRRWQPAQDELVFDFSGALLTGSGDPLAGTP